MKPSHMITFSQKLLHRRGFYTEQLLHAKTFTKRTFCIEKPFPQRKFYTQKRLHRGGFYSQSLLRRNFCTEKYLHPVRTSTLAHAHPFFPSISPTNFHPFPRAYTVHTSAHRCFAHAHRSQTSVQISLLLMRQRRTQASKGKEDFCRNATLAHAQFFSANQILPNATRKEGIEDWSFGILTGVSVSIAGTFFIPSILKGRYIE